ncbi:hypothetical protein Agabi119p4_9954 [Agaricus bisporus var. burnettii]|uniref:Nephrocystin 3-like N-terminal domain-containing protein n=1 Tax=Agaricus bisporus var. burnettii TaxID=192524 RepID=A0A8H7C464_AGABI|nr:hypothetical protein Agabi119p4_9954 [Agaricus bisporus var. burnettii]
MGLLKEAHHFVANNSQFLDQSHHVHVPGQTGIDILRNSRENEAAYNSYARVDAPTCFPGTREQYIEDIIDWATPPSCHSSMFRMKGPAGVGKSAIAQTCAKRLDQVGQLGASFFFTTDRCSNHIRFFPTIAYQLSTKIPAYREILNHIIYSDRTLLENQLESQFVDLIWKPFQELAKAGKTLGTYAILIDGLDECADKRAQCEIVEIVARHLQDMPFRWAFFSRPEPHIETTFKLSNISSLCYSVFLPVSREADGEIKLYIRSGLQNILRYRNVEATGWPSDQELDALIDMTDGLFIYAATVVRFVGQTSGSYDPPELLKAILNSSSRDQYGPKLPMAELDAFYTLILQRIPRELLPDILTFFSLIVTPKHDATRSIAFVSNLLGISRIKMQTICNLLSAVLRLSNPKHFPSSTDPYSPNKSLLFQILSPEGTDVLMRIISGREGTFCFYHKSFRDFLHDPSRSGQFCVMTQTMHETTFERVLRLHSHHARSYTIQNNRLIPLFTGKNSGKGLSWPIGMEVLDSYLELFVFMSLGAYLRKFAFGLEMLDINPHLLAELAEFNHRKQLLSRLFLLPQNLSWEVTAKRFSNNRMNVRGVALRWIPCVDLDMELFQTRIKRLEEVRVIQRYSPHSTTLEPPLFRSDSQGRLLSGLYIVGQGDASIFWYWYFDPELKFRREFETMDLHEGQRVYREVEWDVMDRAPVEQGLRQNGGPKNEPWRLPRLWFRGFKRVFCILF